jgi:protein SCO1
LAVFNNVMDGLRFSGPFILITSLIERFGPEGAMLMTKGVARTTALAAVIIVVVGYITVRPARAGSHWGADYFPNVTLTTQDGKPVKFYDDLLKGKIVVIDLIYTQCKDSCPLETARLRQVQKLLGNRVGKDIFFYSISIDPKHDTPEVLHDYAEIYNAGPGWYFLTGKEDDIVLISKKLGLYSPDWGRDGHTAAVLIGNEPAGQWMRNSATDNPHFLANQIGEFIDNYSNHQAEPVASAAPEAETARLDKLNVGEYLFSSHCAACHTIGQGRKVGPDLAGITNTRNRSWLARYIAAPDKLLDEKDPIAVELFERYKRVRMPNLRLGDADVAALIGFLANDVHVAAAHPSSATASVSGSQK